MSDEAKGKISLDLLYNAICYYHGDADEIVQKLLHMNQATLSEFGASLAATRQRVKQIIYGTSVASGCCRRAVLSHERREWCKPLPPFGMHCVIL